MKEKTNTVSRRAVALSFTLYYLLSVPLIASAVEIPLDPRVTHVINGEVDIPEKMFGAGGYTCATTIADNPKAADILKAANFTTIGLTIMAFPPEKPASPAAALAWYDSPEALDQCNKQGIIRAIKAIRRIGIELSFMMTAGPDWLFSPNNVPLDPELWAACAAGYVKLVKENIDPKFRYTSFFNEANIWWHKDGKTPDDCVDAYIKAAKAIRQHTPDVQLGGIPHCWPPAWYPYSEWRSWDEWTMPLIERAGDLLDYFDYHIYNLPPEVFQEESQAVVNAMHLQDGRHRKVWLTEWGWGSSTLSPEELKSTKARWEKRAFHCAEFLFGALDIPSYVLGMQMFHLQDPRELYKCTIIKTSSKGPEDQYPTYWVFWMFRNLRGQRVFVPDLGESLRAVASRTNGSACLLVLNSGTTARDIQVKLPEDIITADVSWDLLYFDQGKNELSRTSGVGSKLTCPPRSIAAFQFTATALMPQRKIVKDELVFGDSVQNRFDLGPADDGSYGAGQSVKINFDVPAEKLRNARQAYLRIGMLSARVGDDVRLKVGPDTYRLDLSLLKSTSYQKLRHGLNSSWYQTLPLKKVPSVGKNSAVFKLVKRGGPEKKPHILRISSAVLVIRRELSSATGK